MEKILITGAAGFIGSNFVNHFSQRYPHTKIVIVDKLTYAGCRENLYPAINEDNIHFYFGDICDYKLLEDVIEAYHQGRLQALEALEKISDISTKVATHTDDAVPSELVGNDMARRYYGCVRESVAGYGGENDRAGKEIALRIVDRIGKHKIRDWRKNEDAINLMRGEIDDILFEVADEQGMALSLNDHDAIIDRCIEVAIANED